MNLRRPSRTVLSLAIALSFGLTACNAQKSTTTQQQLTQLKELRDSGVLTQQEYDQKVAALKAPASAPHAAATGTAATRTSMTPSVAHTLEDRGWGIPWGTVKLPAGWGFNGGVVHGNNCMVSGDNPMWVAESPDKTVGITVLPVLKTGWVSDQRTLAQMKQAGCPMLHSTRAADFLTQVVLPHLHKSFRVVGTAPEPMFAQMVDMFQKMNAQQPAMNTQMMQNRNTVDTARVVITYEEDGATHNEMASAELSCREMKLFGMNGALFSDTVDCTSYQTVIVHAPDDGTPVTSLATLDLSKSTEKPFFIITPNPAWQQHFQQVMQQQQQAQAQAMQQQTNSLSRPADNSQTEFEKRQAIQRDLQNHTSNVINSVNNNRQLANDQVVGATVAHMGDYNVYTNPQTGQSVQLSNQYNNTYVNQNGTVALQTNSASSPGVDWSQMTPKY